MDRKWQGHTGSTGKWQSDMKREMWLPSDSLRGDLEQLIELGWVLKDQIRSCIDVNTSYCKEGGPFRGPVPVWDQQNWNEGGRSAYHRLAKDHREVTKLDWKPTKRKNVQEQVTNISTSDSTHQSPTHHLRYWLARTGKEKGKLVKKITAHLYKRLWCTH